MAEGGGGWELTPSAVYHKDQSPAKMTMGGVGVGGLSLVPLHESVAAAEKDEHLSPNANPNSSRWPRPPLGVPAVDFLAYGS